MLILNRSVFLSRWFLNSFELRFDQNVLCVFPNPANSDAFLDPLFIEEDSTNFP